MLNPVNKSRLHEEIVTQITRKIIMGELSTGEKLPSERDLAESLKVNRATVREALKKLEILGLVEIRHGDGIYVKDYLLSGNLELLKDIAYIEDVINLDILKNFLFIRKILVPEMAGVAAAVRTEDNIKELESVLSNETASTLEKDVLIHSIIARSSKNLFYIFILNFFNQMFRDFGFLYFNNPSNRKESEKFHINIINAIKKGNEKEAKGIMLDTMIFAEEKIYEDYDKYMKEKGEK